MNRIWFFRRRLRRSPLGSLVVFSWTFSQLLFAQPAVTVENQSQQVGSASDQAITAEDIAPRKTETSSAIRDISGRSFWFSDLFEKGSPLHFGLTAGETYDDNIFIAPQKTADFISHIAPAIDFEKGDRTAANANYLNVFFAPTFFLYADNPKQNRENYNGDFFYQHEWTRLTLGIGQRYQHLTDASIDIGNLAKRDIYTTTLNGNYVYNDKLKLFGTAAQCITSYETGTHIHTNEWIIDGYALYQLAPKTALGIGPRIDFVDIVGAPNEAHQDLLFHLIYDPLGKINVTFSGGLEYLQYQNNAPSHLLPIFDFTANYNPRDGTSLYLSGSRQSVNSYNLAGEMYLNTVIQATFKQRFLRNKYFILSAGYTMADYEFGSLPSMGLQRKDNYYSANIGVEWDLKDWLKLNAHYQYSKDNSNVAQRSFNNNQIDIQASAWF